MVSFMTSNANDFASDAKTDTITDSPTNAASRTKQNTIQDGLSSKSSQSPFWFHQRWECTLDNHFQGCEAVYDIARYHLLQVFMITARKRRQMSFEHQWENGVPTRRLSWYAHHTHCDSTQPVACIRGYEPSGPSHRALWPLGTLGIDPGYISGTKTNAMPSYL